MCTNNNIIIIMSKIMIMFCKMGIIIVCVESDYMPPYYNNCLKIYLVKVCIYRPLGYERVYLPLFVADTPFHIQEDDLLQTKCLICGNPLTANNDYSRF